MFVLKSALIKFILLLSTILLVVVNVSMSCVMTVKKAGIHAHHMFVKRVIIMAQADNATALKTVARLAVVVLGSLTCFLRLLTVKIQKRQRQEQLQRQKKKRKATINALRALRRQPIEANVKRVKKSAKTKVEIACAVKARSRAKAGMEKATKSVAQKRRGSKLARSSTTPRSAGARLERS